MTHDMQKIIIKKERNYESILHRTGFYFIILFFLITFLSKPLINLFGSILLILSFLYIYLYEKKILKQKKYLILFITPYIIGFVFSFLSESGASSSFYFLERFRFVLLIIPLAVFVRGKNQLKTSLALLFSSAMISIFYGIYDGQSYGKFNGFHSIGRTADMMIIVCLSSLVFFVQGKFYLNKKTIFIKCIIAFLVAFFTWAIMMSEMRGAWLGFFIGGIIFYLSLLALNYKILALNSAISILLIISAMYIGNIGGVKNNIDRINEQIESIIEIKNNTSNVTRLHSWKAGWDFSREHLFFGTGAKKSEHLFKAFFYSQPKEYQKKYQYAMHYPKTFHNSYMQILVETGIVFFTLFMSSIFYILFIIIKNMNKVEREDQKYLVAAIVTSFSFLSVQFFHNELYSYGSAPFYLLLFSACYVLNEKDNSIWFGK